MVSWIGISEDSGAFVSARLAQTVSSGVFSSLESVLGYVQIFLVLARPHAPRANTFLSLSPPPRVPLSHCSLPVAAECLLNLKWHGWLCWDREGVGLGVTSLIWHVSSPAPGVYDQPVALRGLSCSSRLCPRTDGNWDSWNTSRFV